MNLPSLDRILSDQIKPLAERLPSTAMVARWNDALAECAEGLDGRDRVTNMLYDANTFLYGVLDNSS